MGESVVGLASCCRLHVFSSSGRCRTGRVNPGETVTARAWSVGVVRRAFYPRWRGCMSTASASWGGGACASSARTSRTCIANCDQGAGRRDACVYGPAQASALSLRHSRVHCVMQPASRPGWWRHRRSQARDLGLGTLGEEPGG